MNSSIEILKSNYQESKNISEIRKYGLTDNENSDSSSSDETPKKKLNKTSSFIKQNSNQSKALKKRVSFYTNEIDEQKKTIKKSKSKFYKNNISNSKLKSLEIFEQNFDLLIDEIEKDKSIRTRSKSTIITNNEININENNENINNEEKIISLTNMEIISDFYEYTENCMRLITEMKPKENNTIKIIPRDFIFENNLQRKKIAVFDLDETLIHCVGDIRTKKKEEYEEIIDVIMPNNLTVKIGINIRPNWKKCLLEIKEKYFIIVYTASHNNYADAVLNFLDPENNIFEGRLYRKDCILNEIENNKFYVKDLNIFKNFDLKDIVLIDNSVLSFAYHLDNGIPIVPYYKGDKDSELIMLSKYLLSISNCNDLRECNKEYINMESFLEQAKIEKIEDNLFDYNEDSENNDEINNNNENYEKREKLIFNKRKNHKKSKTSKMSIKRRNSHKKNLRTHILKHKISIYEENIILDFSNDEDKIQAPKYFKRRNKTIKYKLQSMISNMHFKFIQSKN